MAENVRKQMTAAEFFELPESVLPVELLHGELVMSPAPVPEHQRAIRRICRLLESLIPNGEILAAPIDVYFDDLNIPQPDVVWVAENSHCIIGEKRLEGPPDLIVEVLSPGTTRQDRKTKFRLYEKYGVGEYWLVDPHDQYIEFWTYQNKEYDYQGIFEPGETFKSILLNKTIPVNALFEK